KRSFERVAATQARTRPSAQAACARASGSSSSSAADKTPTSAADPAFPSTTAALRFKPRSLARFIGEPLNATENSAADISSNSRESVRASLPATAGRAANEGTDIGRENLWLYGHTSWHTSHPYRCSPIAPCNSAGISPLSSIVRYEMHRV